MKSAFLGAAYSLRSLPLAAQTCINLYLEPNEAGQGEPGGFYGTPGLLRLATIGSGGHRASIVAGGFLWVVVGNSVYKVTSAYAATLIGTIPNSTGPVTMAENGLQVGIAHPDGWHVVTLATNAMVAVSGAPSLSDIAFIDNYGVGANENGTYSWTALADFTSVDALSFASAEGNPDRIVRTLADHRELWLFGTNTVEVAVVTSDADLPFTRTAFIEQGILAPHSAAKEDNSVLWLGRNEKGQGVVYRADGYVPQRVSTFAVEQAIQTYANPELATAYTYQQDGHHFYVLNFAEATWVCDLNTRLWHQRAYRNTSTGELGRHRSHTHALFNGAHVVGDYADGRLYALDLDTFTDDGDPIYRERTWAQLESENRWIRHHRGELIAEMGVGLDGDPTAPDADPKVWLQWSDDGGRTWGSAQDRSLGRLGNFGNRAFWRRMGIARTRYYRLWTSAAVRIAWRGFNLDMEVASK
jgi:hypothetical protein